MKLLVLLAMTGSAAADDGFVGTLRAGTAYIQGRSEDHGFGGAAGIEGGYAYGRLRSALALDLTKYDVQSGDVHAVFLRESATAKLQVDVIADLVFVFGAVGVSLQRDPGTDVGLRLQGGLGARLWLGHADALRFDASYAHDGVGEPIGELGAALGYEHYF